jgi:arylsulfatase A-like enzyme
MDDAALTQVLWRKGLPAYSMLWMSDPDYSQHQMAPGSEMALAALKSVDDRLGTVLEALDTTGLRNDTDIFVISDHGFSTIQRSDDVVAPLNAAGSEGNGDGVRSRSRRREKSWRWQRGSIMFYVIGHDEGNWTEADGVSSKNGLRGGDFFAVEAAGDFRSAYGAYRDKGGAGRGDGLPLDGEPNIYGAPGMVDADGRPEGGERDACLVERLRHAQHADRGGTGLQEGMGG